MKYTFKVYISDGKENFEYGNGEESQKISLPFSQSLLDLLYLDIWSYGTIFEDMGNAIRKLYQTKDEEWAEKINRELSAIRKEHIYFEFLYLDWCNRLDQAKEKGYNDIVDLLPYKKITHTPSNIASMQDQIKTLFSNVLDIISSDEPIQKKMVNYYAEKGNDTFRFMQQSSNFEVVDNQTFTEVLYPNDIYDIIDFFVRSCVKREQRFRVCKNCGKYFALSGYINTEYCDRPYDSAGRTCKEIGAITVWQKKKLENPALSAFSKEYKRRFAWIRYGKITKEDFYDRAVKARGMRDKCMDGKIDLNEFLEWME